MNMDANTDEAALFSEELKKYKPYQQRLASTILSEQTALYEVIKIVDERDPVVFVSHELERIKKTVVERVRSIREDYQTVRDGLRHAFPFTFLYYRVLTPY